MAGIEKVLVAMDGSPDMEASLEQASRLAAPVNAEILLLRVVTPPRNSRPQDDMREAARESLHHASRKLKGRIRERLWEAEDFCSGLIAVIEAEQPDIVILARPDPDASADAEGHASVHNEILQISHVPVMLVPSSSDEITDEHGSSAATGPGAGGGMGTMAGDGYEPRDIRR